MKTAPAVSLLVLGAACAAQAHETRALEAAGALVSASVEIDGARTPLYPSPDGAERFYLEARQGRPYSLTLQNKSGERVGVALRVDGLDVISGERATGRGRLYVLAPWQRTTVRGWRTSLDEVRQFTFVDERASYAVRSGKANGKLGWIELLVYREREAESLQERELLRDRYEGGPAAPSAKGAQRTYPGTGWGRRTRDPVVEVEFEPEERPSDALTLRYEYARALVALGVLPHPVHAHDRLRERERAEWGFAQPPRW